MAIILAQWQVTHSLAHSRIEHQWSMNDIWSCILDNYRDLQTHLCIITALAAVMGKNASMISLVPPNNEHQRSIKVVGLCILDNQMALQQCHPIIKVLATLMGKNTSEDIATTP
jgi:hypothetical protein